jgi:hypothetical protein
LSWIVPVIGLALPELLFGDAAAGDEADEAEAPAVPPAVARAPVGDGDPPPSPPAVQPAKTVHATATPPMARAS